MNIRFGTYAFGPFDPDVKINRVVQLLAKEVESLKGAMASKPDPSPGEDGPIDLGHVRQVIRELGDFLADTCPDHLDLEGTSPIENAKMAITLLMEYRERVLQSRGYVERMGDCKEKRSILTLLRGERLYGVDILPPGLSGAEGAANLADARVPTQCRRELEDLFGTNDWVSIVDMVKTITRK